MIASKGLRGWTSRHRRVLLRSGAKVNLALEILGKRSDGYHDLATVLQAIDLHDLVLLERAESGISLSTDSPQIPTGPESLVWRAARLLQEASGTTLGARIHIVKRIPVAAGLGGGSSNAAAALLGLNRLWGLRWSIGRLEPLAQRLGMDVPFFLRGGRALATGRGEVLTPLPQKQALWLVLVNPGFPLSTGEVYGRLPPIHRDTGSRTRGLVSALEHDGPAAMAGRLYNALEMAVGESYPDLERIKGRLLAVGALGAVMSGSGPTVFGVAASARQARRIAAGLAGSPWWVAVVHTLGGRVIRPARLGAAT